MFKHIRAHNFVLVCDTKYEGTLNCILVCQHLENVEKCLVRLYISPLPQRSKNPNKVEYFIRLKFKMLLIIII
jgi:hypothetical protein